MITDEQIMQALESAGVEFQYFIHARKNKQVCTTAGSVDFGKIAIGIRELIALAQPQWQPIETVPDSTEVFVAIPKYNNASEHGYLLGWAICIDGQWLSMDDEESSIYTPDYWMHLPQKPQVHGIGGEQ